MPVLGACASAADHNLGVCASAADQLSHSWLGVNFGPGYRVKFARVWLSYL